MKYFQELFLACKKRMYETNGKKILKSGRVEKLKEMKYPFD